jgi:DNA-binding NarL/FixJ family response regulator
MRVVIADDAALLRLGLSRLLADAGAEVCGVCSDADGLLDLVRASRPDVAIVDIRMPPTHTDEGLIAADTIHELFPETGVLVLSQYIEATYALRLLDSDSRGGRGYLLKDRVADLPSLVTALERVVAGEVVVDPKLVAELMSRPRLHDPLGELTSREREVLALVAEGLTDRGIAERLWLTTRTVETHVRHILQKLDIPHGAETNRRVRAVLAYLRSDPV